MNFAFVADAYWSIGLMMQKEIEQVLEKTPGLKAKLIAKKLGVDRKVVSAFLHTNKDQFLQDEDFCWFLSKSSKLIIHLAEESWVDCDSFEKSLAIGPSPLDSLLSSVSFVVPENCKILLDAAARLLALCNQLAWQKKTVTIDFSSCQSTLSYFNRMGFFDHLAIDIAVLPGRPPVSGAVTFKGNNNRVVEFGAIDPKTPDESLPKQLKNSFVAHVGSTGDEYSQPAFTVISELFGNVRDHSEAPMPGFVALQLYKGKKPHIQTVVSDSGKGIVGTLRPILENRYPDIARKLELSDINSDVLLVKAVFEQGGISQSTEDGRGLGLKRSGDVAAKFNAKISVRQETFEVKIFYINGVLDNFSYMLNMPKIFGTHICFDFFLDGR
jgi:hypothetical protein